MKSICKSSLIATILTTSTLMADPFSTATSSAPQTPIAPATPTISTPVAPAAPTATPVSPIAPTAPSNVYTEPSNLSTQAKLNTSVNSQSNFKTISLTDDDIAQKIRLAIKTDNKLSKDSKNAEVVVKNGNVNIKGIVSNQEEKNKIATLVRNTAGVKSFSNNLTISSHR